jgi:hypothetical protein
MRRTEQPDTASTSVAAKISRGKCFMPISKVQPLLNPPYSMPVWREIANRKQHDVGGHRLTQPLCGRGPQREAMKHSTFNAQHPINCGMTVTFGV